MKTDVNILTEKDKEIVRCLQEDLPLCPQPYQSLANRLGMSEQDLLEAINSYLEQGILRRLGAIIKHQQAGFSSNVMIVWRVPREKVEQVGTTLASFPEVSHCYERPTSPQWPYNLFSMVHASSREECEKIIANLCQTIEINDYLPLYSLKELKKISMFYF